MKPFYSSKEFVNLPGCNSDASIFTQIAFYSEDSSSHDATLKIRDCSNSVHLAIGLHNNGDRSYENSLFKLDTLIRELSNLREAMVKAKIHHDELEKLEELERKERQKEGEKDYEVDPGSNNNTPVGGISTTTPTPTDGAGTV